MTQPSVTITELDGALGVLPPTAGRLFAFVGPAVSGPYETPAAFARSQDLVSNFGGGPTVEAAAYFISVTGRPVVFVRTHDTGVAASVGAVTHTGTGASVGTIAASPTPPDDYQYKVFIAHGTATVGTTTDGTYQISRDDGRSYDPVRSLGVATAITLDTGVTLNLSTASLVAGDTYAATAKAAQWSAAELTAALTPLGNSTINWEQLVAIGALDGAAFDAIELKIPSWHAMGKERNWFASPRVPNAGESEAAYLAAMAAIFGSRATTHGSVCYAAAKITSGVSGSKYRRPTVFAVAAAHAVSEEIDAADINLGALPGVAIRDDNGNLDEHDETINPGADDARFIALRTWDGYPGVYINRPLVLSAPGSDFVLVPHRRVLNLAEIALRAYFTRRLNKPVRVDASTGFILEQDALEIEAGARAAMRTALLTKPKASAIQFALSRTDNILSSFTLTGTARVIPLAYPEFIDLTVGFFNPAITVLAA